MIIINNKKINIKNINVNEIIYLFNLQITQLLHYIKKVYKNNDDLKNYNSQFKLIKFFNPCMIIEKNKNDLLNNKDHILTRNKNYFKINKYNDYCFKNFINMENKIYNENNPKITNDIWNYINNMLTLVIVYQHKKFN